MDRQILDKSEIEKKLQELAPWYQNFHLPYGLHTRADAVDYPENKWKIFSEHLPKDLAEKSVLDLGCNAGFFAMKFKELGAKEVVGIDVNKNALKQAKFISGLKGLDITFTNENLYKFLFRTKTKFDYVIFVGVFYHLRYPLLALDKIREITKEKLIFQTEILEKPFAKKENILEIPQNIARAERKICYQEGFPKMFFIEKEFNNDDSNWWISNEPGVQAMLRSAGFTNLKKFGNVYLCDCDPQRSNNNYIDILNQIVKKNL